MKSVQSLLVLLLVCLTMQVSFADSCRLTNIQVGPVDETKSGLFSGTAESIKISLKSEKNDKPVTVFPEPPLTVVDIKTNRQCLIDGGVWIRNSFYISGDSNVLLTHEFSGSNDYLIFYNTKTCGKISEIDISNATWKLRNSKIEVIKRAANPKKSKILTYALNRRCLPETKPKTTYVKE